MTVLSALSKQLMITVKTTPDENLNATPSEQGAIQELLERAEKICPGVQVQYVEKSVDSLGVQLSVSLRTPDLNNASNYELLGIPYDMDEREGFSLVVAQSSLPTPGRQLLLLKSFLPTEKLAVDLMEPKSLQVSWDNPFKRVLYIYLPLTVLIMMVVATFFLLAQNNFPMLFDRDSTPREFELKVGAAKVYLQDSYRRIESQINRRAELGLSEEMVEQLRKEKKLLEKAEKALTE